MVSLKPDSALESPAGLIGPTPTASGSLGLGWSPKSVCKGVISSFEKLCSHSMFPYLQNEVIIASKVYLTEFLNETHTSSKVIYKAFHTFLISHCDTRMVSLND